MKRSDDRFKDLFKLTDARVDYKGRLHLTIRTRDDGGYRSFVIEVESIEATPAYPVALNYSPMIPGRVIPKGDQTHRGSIYFTMRKPPIFSNRRPPRS